MNYIFQGVNIPGLGTFTFSQKKLDVGNNKYILIQRPVFLLSEKFAQTHQVNYTKHHVTGKYIRLLFGFSINDVLYVENYKKKMIKIVKFVYLYNRAK